MAWASICFGVGSIVIGLQLGFPAWWTWGEGPFIILYGAAILWLQRKINTPSVKALEPIKDNQREGD
jgi:hypothetical protein